MSIWSAANIEILTKGVEAGDTYSAIAKRIGFPCTRNSAIGKACRMGIVRSTLDGPSRRSAIPKSRVTNNNPRAFGLVAVIQARANRSPDKPLPASKAPLAAINPKPWAQRQFGECCFPVGGEGADTMSCCNPAPKSSAWNYCPAHMAVMVSRSQPAPVRPYVPKRAA